MPHWSTSPEAGQELEVEYDTALQQYRELKLTGTPREAKDFQNSVLLPLATDLRAARAHWRGIGESLAVNDPNAPGARQFGKTENNREGFTPREDPPVYQNEDGTKTRTRPTGGGGTPREGGAENGGTR